MKIQMTHVHEESEPSDNGMAPSGDDMSTKDLLLGSHSDNPEVPIDPAHEKALLDDSSTNSDDELSKVSSNRKEESSPVSASVQSQKKASC